MNFKITKIQNKIMLFYKMIKINRFIKEKLKEKVFSNAVILVIF